MPRQRRFMVIGMIIVMILGVFIVISIILKPKTARGECTQIINDIAKNDAASANHELTTKTQKLFSTDSWQQTVASYKPYVVGKLSYIQSTSLAINLKDPSKATSVEFKVNSNQIICVAMIENGSFKVDSFAVNPITAQ